MSCAVCGHHVFAFFQRRCIMCKHGIATVTTVQEQLVRVLFLVVLEVFFCCCYYCLWYFFYVTKFLAAKVVLYCASTSQDGRNCKVLFYARDTECAHISPCTVAKFFSCQIKGQAKWKHAPDDEVDTRLA